ncbi:hypothetical protein KDW_10020 [Dictyobacter vulcani]|uniref:DUF402 domain-containing protein n=1 Tax=Dictyobacter vulcani TaxID=2607529 RepID=A0A5J4KKC8_9CHLR|nr:DUF402 domain-containing protein [Dictyobacter vulcani]GER86840.1 hypothetical protein KDW_10020 [Dictyobacter vulcani]
MITVIKLDPQRNEKIRYTGTVLERSAQRAVILATWTLAAKELVYTRFERGDRFVEYYYTDRWFNIFDIIDQDGQRKGWYCNITEPAQFQVDRIEQVDLFLDLWVDAAGTPLLLDEDEFAAADMLSAEQRQGAQQGLQTLLQLLEKRQEAFSSLAEFS